MKSAWMGSGFSHQRVPSLSKVATLSGAGTNESPGSVTDQTKPRIASLAGPWRHDGSGSVAFIASLLFPHQHRLGLAFQVQVRLAADVDATRRIVPPVKRHGCAPG